MQLLCDTCADWEGWYYTINIINDTAVCFYDRAGNRVLLSIVLI